VFTFWLGDLDSLCGGEEEPKMRLNVG